MSTDDEQPLERTDSKSQQIKVLEKLVEKGIINKQELPKMIHAILAQPSPSVQRRRRPKSKDQEIDAKVAATINKRTHRQRASPETMKIRNCIEEPIARRYQVCRCK